MTLHCRESDWLFSTPEGRDKLLKSVEQDRLAVVIMHRGQFYESWDAVKAELTANIKLLKPAGSEDNVNYININCVKYICYNKIVLF